MPKRRADGASEADIPEEPQRPTKKKPPASNLLQPVTDEKDDPLEERRADLLRRFPPSGRMRWSQWGAVAEFDLCAVVSDIQPQLAAHGATQQAWMNVADRLKEAHALYAAANHRNCRDHYAEMLVSYKRRATSEEKVSGDPLNKDALQEQIDAEFVKVS